MTIGPIAGLSAGWLAAGAVAGAAPIIIHLARRRSRPVVYPPAALLARTFNGVAQGRRWQDWLQPVVRALLLATLALAFDEPHWLARTRMPAAGDGPREVVIVLDQSASMGATTDGRSAIDRAQDEAIRLLQSLRPGVDRAGVVFINEEPSAALPELSHNFEALLRRVEAAPLTAQRGDAATAIAVARGFAGPAETAECVVYTDGQEAQWSGISLHESVHIVNVTRSAPANNAVNEIVIPDEGIRADQSNRIGVRIGQYGDRPREVDVTLTVGDLTQRQRAAAPMQGGTTIWFEMPIQSAGTLEVTARLSGEDALKIDNEVKATIVARRPIKCAVISSGRSFDSILDAVVAGALEAATQQAPTLLTRDAFLGSPMPDVDCLAVVRVQEDPVLEDAIRAFAQAGGAVIMAPEGASTEPAEIEAEEVAAFLRLNQDEIKAVIADLAHRVTVAAVSAPRTSGETVLQSSTKHPLITITDLGEGRIASLNFDLSPTHSNLAASPLLPLIIDELISRLTPSATTLSYDHRVDARESDLRSMTFPSSHQSVIDSFVQHAAPPINLWPSLLMGAFFCGCVDVLLTLRAHRVRSEARP